MGLRGILGLTLAMFLLTLSSMVMASTPGERIVGGSEHWHFGFNYTDWAIKNQPFYVGDTLVFKYDPPTKTTSPFHNVFLLASEADFRNCSFKNASRIANETQGAGSGFRFTLKAGIRSFYFACGVHDGAHCGQGLMKFSVLPIKPRKD